MDNSRSQRVLGLSLLVLGTSGLWSLGCGGADPVGVSRHAQGGALSTDAGPQASGSAGTSAPAQLAGAGASSAATPDDDGGTTRFTAPKDLDPNLSFGWTDTLPGQGTCKPGKYTGMFTCTYGAFPVTGPVTLEFTKSMDGEFLDLANGQLSGAAAGFYGFKCSLKGRLDCSTLKFEASAINGVFGLGDPSTSPLGMFDGTLSGKLDKQTLQLSGDWSLGITGDTTRCPGPWTADFTP
jgi:hypothetical protein